MTHALASAGVYTRMNLLEKKPGLDRRYLSRIETGEVNPTIIQAIRIADALGLTFGGLVSRAQGEWKAQRKRKP